MQWIVRAASVVAAGWRWEEEKEEEEEEEEGEVTAAGAGVLAPGSPAVGATAARRNQQRMVARMLNPTLATATRPNPHLRRVLVVSIQVKSGQRSIFDGSLIGMPTKYLLPQTTLMNLSEAFITSFKLASEVQGRQGIPEKC